MRMISDHLGHGAVGAGGFESAIKGHCEIESSIGERQR